MRHEHHGKSTAGSFPMESILNVIKNNEHSSILDLGCGDGYISFIMAENFKESKIFAQDIYKPSIEKVIENIKEKKAENIYPIHSGGQKIPLDNDFLDITIMSNVYHGFHINNEIDPVFSEISRVSKTNSMLIIIERSKQSDSENSHGHIRMNAEEVLEGIKEFGYFHKQTLILNDKYYAGIFILEDKK